MIPVVALPGWFIERTKAGGVPVVNPRNPRTLLKLARSGPLPDPVLKSVAFQLEQKVRDVDIANSRLVGGTPTGVEAG